MDKQIDYIKNIIENEYGITNPEAYIEYKKIKFDSGITLDEVNRLSPDTIDSGSFWEYIEKESVFNRDAIAYGYENTTDIFKINGHNYVLACQLGVLNYVFARFGSKMNLLDVGAGYGFLRQVVHDMTKFDYFGVDVCPKIEGIYKIQDCILPTDIMQLQYGLIISTNVFQHLSVRQRNIYYEQIAQILDPNYGVFSVSNIHNSNRNIGFLCKENDKRYTCHYGQYTEIQSIQEIADDLTNYFNIVSHSLLSNNSITFHCSPKKMRKI